MDAQAMSRHISSDCATWSLPDNLDLQMLQDAQAYLECKAEHQIPSEAEEQAWEWFHRTYDPLLHHFILSCHVPRDDAKDCLQEVWSKVVKAALEWEEWATGPPHDQFWKTAFQSRSVLPYQPQESIRAASERRLSVAHGTAVGSAAVLRTKPRRRDRDALRLGLLPSPWHTGTRGLVRSQVWRRPGPGLPAALSRADRALPARHGGRGFRGPW